jgi:hypothetical protein
MIAAPGTSPKTAPASDPVVPADVECGGCGYNLRGLAAGSACPECRRPVADTVLRAADAAGAADALRAAARDLVAPSVPGAGWPWPLLRRTLTDAHPLDRLRRALRSQLSSRLAGRFALLQSAEAGELWVLASVLACALPAVRVFLPALVVQLVLFAALRTAVSAAIGRAVAGWSGRGRAAEEPERARRRGIAGAVWSSVAFLIGLLPGVPDGIAVGAMLPGLAAVFAASALQGRAFGELAAAAERLFGPAARRV